MSYNDEPFYEFFIHYCAPTMARLKCANMMSCPNDRDCAEDLARIRSEVVHKGVEIEIMFRNPDRQLVLVYRPLMLAEILKQSEIREFLGQFGYQDFSVEGAVAYLKSRISLEGGQFPHEIGVFLGYPLADTRGFIENRGQNDLLCGEWKVYHEPEKARKIFANLQKCREIYLALYAAGKSGRKMTPPGEAMLLPVFS